MRTIYNYYKQRLQVFKSVKPQRRYSRHATAAFRHDMACVRACVCVYIYTHMKTHKCVKCVTY